MNRSIMPVVVAAAAAGFLLTGCAPKYMTPELRSSLDSADLSKIQYKLKGRIILRREMRTSERGVTQGHNVQIINGKRIEEIEFPAETVGVMVRPPVRDDEMFISFESGTDKYPDPALPFRVTRLADGSSVFGILSGAQFTYEGEPFTACVGSAGIGSELLNSLGSGDLRCPGNQVALLIVDLKVVKQSSRAHRVVTGRHVGD